MGKYRTIDIDLNRKYRDDLNWNFEQIERDFNSSTASGEETKQQLTDEIERVERESIERDNLISGENVPAIIESINNATNAANAAATNATAKGDAAEQKGVVAQSNGDYAKQQGDYAKQKGDYADEKAQLANTAATNANNESSNLGTLKTEVVAATQSANTAATTTKQQGDAAQVNGDYAKTQGDYAKAQGDRVEDLVTGTGFIPSAEKGQPNGVATLGADGKVPSTQLNVDTTAIEQSIQQVQSNLETHELEKATKASYGHVKIGEGIDVSPEGVISVIQQSAAQKVTFSAIKANNQGMPAGSGSYVIFDATLINTNNLQLTSNNTKVVINKNGTYLISISLRVDPHLGSIDRIDLMVGSGSRFFSNEKPQESGYKVYSHSFPLTLSVGDTVGVLYEHAHSTAVGLWTMGTSITIQEL